MCIRDRLNTNVAFLKKIKRDILFFDKLVINPIYLERSLEYIEQLSKGKKLKPETKAVYSTIRFLINEQVIQEETWASMVKNSCFKNANKDEVKLVFENHKKIKEKFNARVEEILKRHGENKKENYLEFLWTVYKYEEFLTRSFSSFLEVSDKYNNVTSITNSFGGQFPDKSGIIQDKVINLVINNFPQISETVDVEKVLEFKNHPESQRKLLALKRWISMISSSSNFNKELILEELEYLLAEYENHIRLQKMKYSYGLYDVFIKMPLEIVEKIVKVQWSEIPDVILKLKKIDVELAIQETKAPGREIAYLSHIKSKLN